MKDDIPQIKLNNGVSIPQLGLGVWQAQNGSEVEKAVIAALDAGYRLIDTAAIYGNEVGVGNAIKASNISRQDLFITTKVWNTDQGYGTTLKAFDDSLNRLQLDYIDMYLIHWPMPQTDKYLQTWKAMEELYDQGKVKAIGVCNFQIPHLQRLLDNSRIKPVVNQIELHPYFIQSELREFAHQNDVRTESWSPIGGSGGGGGRTKVETSLLDQPILLVIGKKYDKSPAQVVIRWHIQHGLIVIPKSVHVERIIQNKDVFDFELSDGEMKSIDALHTGVRGGADPNTYELT